MSRFDKFNLHIISTSYNNYLTQLDTFFSITMTSRFNQIKNYSSLFKHSRKNEFNIRFKKSSIVKHEFIRIKRELVFDENDVNFNVDLIENENTSTLSNSNDNREKIDYNISILKNINRDKTYYEIFKNYFQLIQKTKDDEYIFTVIFSRGINFNINLNSNDIMKHS